VAERVRSLLIDSPVASDAGDLPVTASFGVASTDQCPDARLERVVRAADLAMYRAKCDGRNRVVVAEDTDWRVVTSPATRSVPAA
jgi:diguanylate cyclase (GGDEF)-like protein